MFQQKTKRKIMTIPQTTYVIDNQGQKAFVQLTIQDIIVFLYLCVTPTVGNYATQLFDR